MARELIRAPGHDRNRSLGWLGLAWVEHFCVHGPGDVEGRSLDPEQPDSLPLDDEFAAYIIDVYAVDRAGRRLYDSAFLSRAKGRAKSELAAFIAMFEAFGPCRFAGFADGGEVYEWHGFRYVYEPGEPMGRRVTYPFIRCLATEESQAGNTYDNIYYNVTEGPLSEGLPRYSAGLTRTILPDGGEIVPSTASNAAKDGGKESHAVFDETHLYVIPELRRMYNTVRRNLAKRKDAEPWSNETSTMYLPGEKSSAEETHKLARLIRQGKIKRPRLLFDHRQAPDDVDLSSEKQVMAALREAYGPFSGVMDLRRIVDEIWDPRNPAGESRRYFFNQPTSAIDAYIMAHDWAGRLNEDLALNPGDLITLGFDGSRGKARGKPDATALVACRLFDGFIEPIGVWEAPDGPEQEQWTAPVTLIDAAVRHAFRTYKVVGFYADPAKDWRSHVNAWEARYAGKVKVKASSAHPFEWWMNGGRTHMNQRAIEAFEAAVRHGELWHAGHYALTAHVLNARRRLQAGKLTLAKKNDYSPDKIDACVAAVLAYQARLDAIAKGYGKTSRAPTRAR